MEQRFLGFELRFRELIFQAASGLLQRMTYGTFRKTGYFIGSGVVEAGCKTVVGKRMKCSGMFWSEEGGQGMLDLPVGRQGLRCAFATNRLDAFWQDRAAQHAPHNHPLKFAA